VKRRRFDSGRGYPSQDEVGLLDGVRDWGKSRKLSYFQIKHELKKIHIKNTLRGLENLGMCKFLLSVVIAGQETTRVFTTDYHPWIFIIPSME